MTTFLDNNPTLQNIKDTIISLSTDKLNEAPLTGDQYARQNGQWVITTSGAWGDITGNIEDQTDLQNALDKINESIASEFDKTIEYFIGDYVYYDGILYKFISHHNSNGWNISEVESIIADEFNSEVNYSISDVISYNNIYYQFINDHLGEWNDEDVTIIPEFDSIISYEIGDYVLYEENLYRFISNHSNGEWDNSEVIIVNISNELKNKVNISDVGGIEIRPDYIVSTTDLTDGVSILNSGRLYFYYEEQS